MARTRWAFTVTLRAALLVGAAGVAGTAACAGRRGGATAADRDVISREEIQRTQFNNLYDLVRSLRYGWLNPRGQDSIRQPGEVQVHVDDVRVGGVDALRNISPAGVASLRFVDPVAASGRWGFNHAHGAILVLTRPF